MLSSSSSSSSSSVPPLPAPRKKRNRVPLSCTNCRRKKIKCDRTKPVCKVCQAHDLLNCEFFHNSSNQPRSKPSTVVSAMHSMPSSFYPPPLPPPPSNIYNNHHHYSQPYHHNHHIPNTTHPYSLAHNITYQPHQPLHQYGYQNPPASNCISLISIIDNLLSYLKVSPNDEIPVYQDSAPIYYFNSFYNHFGPFSWLFLLKKDPFSIQINDAAVISRRVIINKFLNSPIHLNHNLQSVQSTNNNSSPCKGSKTEILLSKIIEILPSKKLIDLFIDRFFKFIYPFLPYLDEDTFKCDIEKILNSRTNHNKITKLTINEHSDLAIIGILLLVIKFSYDSLTNFFNQPENHHHRPDDDDDDNVNKLLSYPHSNSLLKLTKLCLDEFLLVRRCPLIILQLCLLLKEYQKLNGSDAIADGEAQIYTGLLIQIASLVGLDRDPVIFESLCSPKLSLLRRKIWYGLVSLDIYQFTQSSFRLNIQLNQYDTKLPQFIDNISNITDLKLEKITIDLINLKFKFELKMLELATYFSNLNENPKISKSLHLLFDLENELKSNFVSFNDILLKNHFNDHYLKIIKVSHLIIYFNAINLLKPCYMHLFYHFQKIKHFNFSFFIHNKILSIWMYPLSNLENLILNSHKFFDIGFDSFLLPVIQIFLHKGMIFFLSSFIKSKLFLSKLNSSSNTDPQLVKIVQHFNYNIILKLVSNIHVHCLQILSSKYFYAWRLLKNQAFILTLLKTDKIDFSNQSQLYNFYEFLNFNNYELLISLTNWENYKISNFISSNYQPNWMKIYLNDLNNFSIQNIVSFEIPINERQNPILIYETNPYQMFNISCKMTMQDERWFASVYAKLTLFISNSYSINKPDQDQLRQSMCQFCSVNDENDEKSNTTTSPSNTHNNGIVENTNHVENNNHLDNYNHVDNKNYFDNFTNPLHYNTKKYEDMIPTKDLEDLFTLLDPSNFLFEDLF